MESSLSIKQKIKKDKFNKEKTTKKINNQTDCVCSTYTKNLQNFLDRFQCRSQSIPRSKLVFNKKKNVLKTKKPNQNLKKKKCVCRNSI